MDILHNIDQKLFFVRVDEYMAYVEYRIQNGALDILHTVVPHEIGGRGIAAALVQSAYDYALANHLKPAATCSYAIAWLEEHPEYQTD